MDPDAFGYDHCEHDCWHLPEWDGYRPRYSEGLRYALRRELARPMPTHECRPGCSTCAQYRKAEELLLHGT